MSASPDYTDSLRDILENAHKVQRFVAGIEYEAFVQNDEKIYAVYHALAIIGEAARQIPPAVRKRYNRVPWDDVTGMRDRLIHGYSGIKIRRVWETVENDLPILIITVEQMLKDLAKNS